MVRFSKLMPDGTETDVRFIEQSDMMKCPHFIMDPQHYRSDNTCKCNDPDEIVMREWGYKWNKTRKQWR